MQKHCEMCLFESNLVPESLNAHYMQETHSCGSNNGATLWTGLILFALPDMCTPPGSKCHSVTFMWLWKDSRIVN